MSDELQMKDFIEKNLDKISVAGEWVGKNLGSMGRAVQKILIAAGVLFIFGLAAFLWSVGRGMMKKDKS